MKRLLVLGASRGIGLATVAEALERGLTVTALARHASSIQIQHPQLKKLDADVLDAKPLADAIASSDAVIQSLGVAFNRRLITGPITLFSQATALLVKTMQQHHVQRLISVTGFGAGSSHAQIHWLQRPAFELLFGRAYADKSKQEASITTSNLDWTIVRPGMLTNGAKRTDYHVLKNQNDWVNGSIARTSVAHYLVEQMLSPDAVHQSPVLVQQRWF